MNNFKIIYRILSLLDRCKGDEDFDYNQISAETLRIGYAEWEQLLIELQRNGYLKGLTMTQTLSDKFPHIVEPACPAITLKGMEYLSENSLVKKAGKLFNGLKDIAPYV